MSLIQWNDDLSVKVTEIDGQHKQLVTMINDLHEAMKSRQGKEQVRTTLAKMADYVVTHFSTEEKYMAKFGYPGYLGHKAEHQAFMKKVTEFTTEFDAGRAAVTIELMNFLKDWLTNHIMKKDKQYSDFFLSKGLK